MLDDLRNTAATPLPEEESVKDMDDNRARRRRERGPFLGMTPFQRLVLVMMLLFLTCVIGSFCLLLTGRVVLPF